MKLSMEQTAYVVGKTKKTIYNHKDANKFTWETNNDGNAVIDASEILRVYGSDNGITQRLEGLQTGQGGNEEDITPRYTPKPATKKPALVDEDYIEFIRLKEEKKFRDEKITLLEDEKEKWENLAHEAQKSVQKITLLLEDHSQSNTKKDDWERSIKALENRIANQERAEKEREQREKKLLDENKRIRQAYSKQKRALEEEKQKPLWRRIFG